MAADIQVYANGAKFKITEDNFSEGTQKIAGAIKPGTPVMLRNYQYDTNVSSIDDDTNYFFYSNGKIDKDGQLGALGGKRHSFYFTICSDTRKYNIVAQDTLKHSMILPYTNSSQAFNEGTFSNAGPSSWPTFRGAGTKVITIGEEAIKMHTKEFSALSFANNAILFQLPYAYACPAESLDIKIEDFEKQSYDKFKELACINSAMNLINSATNEADLGTNVVRKISKFRGEIEKYAAEYNASIDDYLVIGSVVRNRQKHVAIIKARVPHAFILPLNGHDKILERAFSDKNVSKYYPAGK